MLASQRPFFLRTTGGLLLSLSACRSAPRAVGVVEECVQIPGRVVVVPGVSPDSQLGAASRRAGGLVDPLTGKTSGIAALVVTVLNNVGRPVKNAKVVIPDTDRGRTDNHGQVEFRMLAPREHQITIAAPNMVPQELALASRAGFRDSIRAYLTTPSLAVPCDQRR